MNNELLKYARGEMKPGMHDRAIAKAGKRVYDEIRLRALEADGAVALAGHLMEQIVDLDAHRRSLAGDDPVLNHLLTQVEQTAVRQAAQIQRGLFNPWGI